MKTRYFAATLVVALGTSGAFAQTTAETVQRDVNQQTRIENGLKDGSLNTKEAGRLESEQSRIDRLQSKDLKDGSLTLRERAQLRRAQNRASQDIKAAESNSVHGNPDSSSSQRMQADVQPNVNQQKRIEQGVQSGALTNREVGGLERGQAKVDRNEGDAARDGHVSQREQAAIAKKEHHQSGRIFDKKHNRRIREG